MSRVNCYHCDVLVINNLICHEEGCPLARESEEADDEYFEDHAPNYDEDEKHYPPLRLVVNN